VRVTAVGAAAGLGADQHDRGGPAGGDFRPPPAAASYARFRKALAVPQPVTGTRSIISAKVAFWQIPKPVPNRHMPAIRGLHNPGSC
jgi:hypothetical protein